MSRIAYVNGRYGPKAAAAVAIDDRGYQFADGIYEVIEISGGELIDEAGHVARLHRSLRELRIDAPLTGPALALVLRETVRRNRVRDGIVYIQVTRGVSPRDHIFPDPPVKPAIVVTAKSTDRAKIDAKASAGIKVITTPDLRWKRPDIKSISLLPNVLAKQDARLRGAGEAWLTNADGLIHEGASSNAWIIDGDRRLITHPVTQSILNGITRTTLMRLIGTLGLAMEERAFSLAEAHSAHEAFITGATSIVTPVVAIDDRPVGDGRPGPIALELRRRFHEAAQRTPG